MGWTLRNEGKCERRGKESDGRGRDRGANTQTLQEAEKPESSGLFTRHAPPRAPPPVLRPPRRGAGVHPTPVHLRVQPRGLSLLVPACLSSKSPRLERTDEVTQKRTCNLPSQVEREFTEGGTVFAISGLFSHKEGDRENLRVCWPSK